MHRYTSFKTVFGFILLKSESNIIKQIILQYKNCVIPVCIHVFKYKLIGRKKHKTESLIGVLVQMSQPNARSSSLIFQPLKVCRRTNELRWFSLCSLACCQYTAFLSCQTFCGSKMIPRYLCLSTLGEPTVKLLLFFSPNLFGEELQRTNSDVFPGVVVSSRMYFVF